MLKFTASLVDLAIPCNLGQSRVIVRFTVILGALLAIGGLALAEAQANHAVPHGAALAKPTTAPLQVEPTNEVKTAGPVGILVDTVPTTSEAHPAYIVIDATGSWWHRAVFDDPDDAIIMIFTIVLGLSAMYQARLLNRQDAKLRESIDETKRSAERQQRAYLSVEPISEGVLSGIGTDRYDPPGTRFNSYGERDETGTTRQYSLTGKDKLVNRGQTPAYDVSYHVKCYWVQANTPSDKDSKIAEYKSAIFSNSFTHLGVLNPDASATIYYHGITAVIDFQQFSMDLYNLFVVLKITYIDAFKEKREIFLARSISGFDGASRTIEIYQDGSYSN